MKVEAVNLANNHIQDKGILCISDTIHNLQAENINYFGAGISSVDAKKPYFIYIFLERMNASFMAYTWRYGIYFFYFKQLGLIETIRKILKKIRRKF